MRTVAIVGHIGHDHINLLHKMFDHDADIDIIVVHEPFDESNLFDPNRHKNFDPEIWDLKDINWEVAARHPGKSDTITQLALEDFKYQLDDVMQEPLSEWDIHVYQQRRQQQLLSNKVTEQKLKHIHKPVKPRNYKQKRK